MAVIKDNQTGLFCTSYSTSLPSCSWGNQNDAVEFATLELAQSAADDMNNQIGFDRFIGQNPKPR